MVETRFKTERIRSKKHMAFVATQPCLVCGRSPVQVHHLTCAPEPKARGLKAGDNWTVPVCVMHHNAIHGAGNETRYWSRLDIYPIFEAKRLWAEFLESDQCVGQPRQP